MNTITKIFSVSITALFLTGTAYAEQIDDEGELNPEELSIAYMADQLEAGRNSGPMIGVHGYKAAHCGDFKTARRIFKYLADRGNTQAMAWMSWADDNGLGAPENPAAATEWNRLAMERGDAIGTYNYGLALMRGRGVEQNIFEGRRYIDKAAALGDESALVLASNNYKIGIATPDADNWKYDQYLY